MIFKTVDFNIFRENLQKIVYGQNSDKMTEKFFASLNRNNKKTEKLREIVIKPLVNKNFNQDK